MFTTENWNATQDVCDTMNAALTTLLAAYSAAELEDGEVEKGLSDRLNNAYVDGISAGELVTLARR